MGAVQAVPVVGEVVTVLDSAGRTVAAGVCYPFDHQAADKLIKSAGKSWEDYSDRSMITSNIRLACAELNHDGPQTLRLMKAQAQAMEELGENTPVVGHVMAVVHYCDGDEEGAERCLNSANRSTAILAVTVATGGAGAVAAGTATLVAGVAYDAAVTAEKSIEKGEFTPSGYIDLAAKAIKTGDACDVYNVVTTPIADFASGALGGEGGNVTRQATVKMPPLSELSSVSRKVGNESSVAASTSDFHFSYHEPNEGALATNEPVAGTKAPKTGVNYPGEQSGPSTFGGPRPTGAKGGRAKPSDAARGQAQRAARSRPEMPLIADPDAPPLQVNLDHMAIEDMDIDDIVIEPRDPVVIADTDDVHMALHYEDCAWRCVARLKDMPVEQYAKEHRGVSFGTTLTRRTLSQIEEMVDQQHGILVTDVHPDMVESIARQLNERLGTKKAAVAYDRLDNETGHVITIEPIRKRPNPKNRLEAEYIKDHPKGQYQLFDYQPPTDATDLEWIATKGVNARPEIPDVTHVFAVPPVEGDIAAQFGRAPTDEAVLQHHLRKKRGERQLDLALRRQNGRDAILTKRRGLAS
ncbi:hypothetical protein B0I37DRAFT_377832 [Chaetomium sp. MPI-CAGE-AT-0009]|nr:hypothetical protein B0I37DRAFT_377832 [Chaetomium sp. MPI-CAGE-AT-0009]